MGATSCRPVCVGALCERPSDGDPMGEIRVRSRELDPNEAAHTNSEGGIHADILADDSEDCSGIDAPNARSASSAAGSDASASAPGTTGPISHGTSRGTSLLPCALGEGTPSRLNSSFSVSNLSSSTAPVQRGCFHGWGLGRQDSAPMQNKPESSRRREHILDEAAKNRLKELGEEGETTLRALKEAEALMKEYNVLEAERVLCAALAKIKESADKTRQHAGENAADLLTKTEVFREVSNRTSLYSEVGRHTLGVRGDSEKGAFDKIWQQDDDQVHVRLPPSGDGTWVEVKVAIRIDAPLRNCMVPANEMDLQPQWNKSLLRAPASLGLRNKFHQVTHQLIGILMFRIELIVEVFRVCNLDFGFFVERIRSDFPIGDIALPEKDSWRTKRVNVDTSNIWLPIGDSSPGTILVQVSRLDLGFAVPEKLAKSVFKKLASNIVGNLKRSALMATEKGTVWQQRLQADNLGLYAELQRVEAAARQRRRVTTTDLPGVEVFERHSQLETWHA